MAAVNEAKLPAPGGALAREGADPASQPTSPARPGFQYPEPTPRSSPHPFRRTRRQKTKKKDLQSAGALALHQTLQAANRKTGSPALLVRASARAGNKHGKAQPDGDQNTPHMTRLDTRGTNKRDAESLLVGALELVCVSVLTKRETAQCPAMLSVPSPRSRHGRLSVSPVWRGHCRKWKLISDWFGRRVKILTCLFNCSPREQACLSA